MAEVILKFNNAEMGRWEVGNAPLVVGRGAAAQIVVDSPVVAEAHCRIERSGEQVTVVDLGSELGILVNGLKVPQATLENGSIVTVGTYVVEYVDRQSTAKDDESHFEKTMQKDMRGELTRWAGAAWQLKVRTKAYEQAVRLEQPDYIIGSSDDCDITIQGRGVAPNHVVLVLDDLGIRAINVSGKDDVKINGKPAGIRAVLSPNDVIGIRDCELTLVQE
jgi:pSer/pThr/pTyr-binding forkhead associated (FHA) protein